MLPRSTGRRLLLWPLLVVVLPPLAGMQAGSALAQGPAAPRVCKPRIEWESTGPTRREARLKARSGWQAAVSARDGEAFANLGVAGIARTQCVMTPDGHRCKVGGSPCRDLPRPAAAPPGPPPEPRRIRVQ